MCGIFAYASAVPQPRTQVLETLHLSYESLDSKDERAMDVGINLAMAVALKACFFLGLWKKSTDSSEPLDKAPETAEPARPASE